MLPKEVWWMAFECRVTVDVTNLKTLVEKNLLRIVTESMFAVERSARSFWRWIDKGLHTVEKKGRLETVRVIAVSILSK